MRAPCPAAQLLDTIHGFNVPIVGRGRSLLERAGDGVTFGGSERPREASASDIRSPMPTAPVRGIPAGASIRRRACWLAGALGPTTLGWVRRRAAAGDAFTMSTSARDRAAHRQGAPCAPCAPRRMAKARNQSLTDSGRLFGAVPPEPVEGWPPPHDDNEPATTSSTAPSAEADYSASQVDGTGKSVLTPRLARSASLAAASSGRPLTLPGI